MVSRIVREVNPDQVYLFGSLARRDEDAGSNVDLLIIEKESFGPNRSRREEISRIRNASRTFRVPKDVIVYSKEEMEKWKDSANHIAGRGVREGRWLYERS